MQSVDTPEHDASDTVLAEPSRSLSLLNLLEIVFAYGAVFATDRYLHQVHGWDAGVLILLSCMYPFKILLSNNTTWRPWLSLMGYGCLAAATLIWPISTEWDNQHITRFGLIVCIPVIFLTVPTITFCIDIMTTGQRSPRYYIWRSVIEIVVLFPPWLYASVMLSLFMGGWWI